MKKLTLYASLFAGMLLIDPTQAICINNKTPFTLHYDIQNQNMGRCSPKVKHYSGDLSAKSQVCFAHTRADGPDWQIYRKDRIIVDTVENSHQSRRACNKIVTGIMNTLRVSYHDWNQRWWCLDDHDDED